MPQQIITLKGTARIEGQKIIYMPNPGEVGIDNFSYLAETSDGATAEATVTVEIQDVFGLDDIGFEVIQGRKQNLDVLEGIEGATLLKTLKKEPKKGLVSFTGNGNNVKLSYQSGKKAKGQDTFSFEAQNVHETKASATVTITIIEPKAIGDSFSTSKDSELTIPFKTVLQNDDAILKENNKIKELFPPK